MTRGIRLSPRHGVNPSVAVCYFCGEDTGELVLAGHMKGDAEAPRRAVWTRNPCPTCAEHMSQGVMLISVENGAARSDNPPRTGAIAVLRDEAVRRIFGGPAVDRALKLRFAFVEDAAWDAVGLPRGGDRD